MPPLIPSLIPEPQNAFSLDIHHAKKDTSAIVLKLENCLSPWMLLSLGPTILSKSFSSGGEIK